MTRVISEKIKFNSKKKMFPFGLFRSPLNFRTLPIRAQLRWMTSNGRRNAFQGKPERNQEGAFTKTQDQIDAESWAKLFTADMMPKHAFHVQTSRSAGAGGQHVNRTDSKVELRFHLDSADWMPAYVKEQLRLAVRP
jgi:hypothetical protein